MAQGNPDTREQNPYHIHKNGQATPTVVLDNRCLTERQQSQDSDFENLQTKRYADNGATQGKAGHKILDSHHETAENNPNDISQCTHKGEILK